MPRWTAVELREITSERVLRKLGGRAQEATRVAFSPDGRWIASEGLVGIHIWESATGRQVYQLTNPSRRFEDAVGVISLAFDPKSQYLAAGLQHIAPGNSESTIRVWDLNTGREIRTLEGHGGTAYSVAFSPDGTLLAGSITTDRLRFGASRMETTFGGWR